ncbi:MAG TPA: ABC transporter ATP-binding protein [Actinospica sp.]|nr:ABC transporter ATP-binding protein [Actinospica sp.]
MTFRTIRGLLRCAPDAGGRLLAAIGLLTLMQTLAPAALALITAALIGRIQQAAPDALVAAAAVPLLLFALVLGVGHAADAALEPLQYLATSRVDGAYRARITEIAATGPTIDGLEDPHSQELLRAAKADPGNWTERTPGTGLLGLFRVAATMLGVLASGAVLARFAWWLLPLVVVPALVQWRIYGGRNLRFMRRWRDSLPHMIRGSLLERTVVSPGESKDIRIYGLGDWLTERIQEHLRAAFTPIWAGLRVRDEWELLLSVGLPFGTALVLVADAAATGHTTVAVESAVLSAGLSVYQALGWSDNLLSVGSAGECLTAYEELVGALGAPDGVRIPAPRTPAPAEPLPDRVPVIAFEGVGFRYPGSEHTVLDAVDLEIRPGELLALVGLNGAGKSTLIKLLSMLYTPTAGRITADGTDLARLGPEAWRSLIAVVFQDFVRYELSAADNVLLGRGDLSPDLEELAEAARESGFAEVLGRLPDGWDTPLARTRTGGVDLSGGQWQQLVLTRALYALRKGARLLVLDEPTAHLDVRTEFDVFRRLAERRGEASIVLISHRLSTVRYADRIVLLDAGRITETGTHEELIAADGGYARMFAVQAERFHAGYEDHIEEGELL